MHPSGTPQLPFAGDLGAAQVLGRYELLMPIASGGMAMVWAARLKGTRGFQKIVAIKTMLPTLSDDERFEQMFLDEAALASQIRHPHVVEIMDLGEQDGVLYLVMEWIDGVPLTELIRAARRKDGIPLSIAARLVGQTLAGLHAAHELKDPAGQLVGLVHRDVSPQNILVTFDGVGKVVDFGIAKATAIGDGGTAAGQVKGKISYMAPEQVRAKAIDRRADIFAAGIVLYILTTGKHPFRGENDAETISKLTAPEPPIAPRRLVPSYPVTLERVVMQALAKDPAKRFPTANEMLKALNQALPVSMRGATDDDVASFVQALLSDKWEKQKGNLARALESADARAASGAVASLRDLVDSQPPPPSTTSGVTEISGVTASSVYSAASPSMPDIAGPGPVPSQPGVQTRASRRWLVVGALALGLLLAGATTVLVRRGEPAAEAPAPQAPVTPSPPTVEEPAEPLAAAEPPETSAPVAAGELPSEPEPAAKPTPKLRRTAAPPATAKPTATSKGPGWKHDPGF